MEKNRITKTLKIFIVLYCFWEGDGYLVNEYKDCFLSEQDAISFANTLKYGGKTIKVFLPDEELPDESTLGHSFGGVAFAQIIEKVF